MTTSLTNKIKLRFAETAFKTPSLINTPFKRHSLAICLSLEQLCKSYFPKKKTQISDFESFLLDPQNSEQTPQFKFDANISYDEIKISVKGVLTEGPQQISINIFFQDKLKSVDDLVHITQDFSIGKDEEPLGMLLLGLEKSLRTKFFDLHFKGQDKEKEEVQNPQIDRTRNDNRNNTGGNTAQRNPLLADPPQRYPYPGIPGGGGGWVPRSPNYPGLTPYIRYGKQSIL